MKKFFLISFLVTTSWFNCLIASENNVLESQKFKEIARNLYAAQNLVPDEKFEFSSNISLGVYFLRYLGDLGSFTLDSNEINKLILAIENLYKGGVNDTLKSILLNLQRVKFYKDKKNYVVIIFTKNEQDIIVDIDSKRDGFVQSINSFKIKNKSKVVLQDIISKKTKKKVLRKVKQRQRLFHAPNVNLIDKNYVNSMSEHFKKDVELSPVSGEIDGMEFNISLKKWVPKSLREINLKVDKVGSNIGIKGHDGELLPPFWLTAKKWWIHVISIIDS